MEQLDGAWLDTSAPFPDEMRISVRNATSTAEARLNLSPRTKLVLEVLMVLMCLGAVTGVCHNADAQLQGTPLFSYSSWKFTSYSPISESLFSFHWLPVIRVIFIVALDALYVPLLRTSHWAPIMVLIEMLGLRGVKPWLKRLRTLIKDAPNTDLESLLCLCKIIKGKRWRDACCSSPAGCCYTLVLDVSLWCAFF